MNDLNKLTVKVKRACHWQDYDHARLQISVGQSYHEGAEFEATLEWARENFETVTICVNDTLQRHNYLFQGFEADEAYKLTENAGREWIERNCAHILSSSIHIVRWDEWLKHPDYMPYLEKIRTSYNSVDHIKIEVNEEINRFWQRRLKSTPSLCDNDFVRFHIHSHDYLIEECAAFSIMFAKQKAADIYPGSTLLPCTLFKGLGPYGFTRIDFSSQNKKAA